jgi:hypothetical protein
MIRLLIVTIVLAFATAFAQAQSKSKANGADSEEGWIIRRTSKGIIKIPRKQRFRFSGSGIEAEANRPSQSVLGKRDGRANMSLIPVRTSFRKEMLGVSGIQEK